MKTIKVETSVYLKLSKLKYDLIEKSNFNFTLSEVIEMLLKEWQKTNEK